MRVAVFDLDGTLADTAADLIAAANAALAEAGLGRALEPARDAAVAFAGGRAMLRRGLAGPHGSVDAAAVDRLYPRLLALYGEGIAVQTRLYDGAEAALGRLAAAGWGLAVCTNKPEALAVRLLAALGIGGRFRGGARGGQPRLPQAGPAAPDRDDRARRRAAGTGGAGRRHRQRPRGGARGRRSLRAGRLRPGGGLARARWSPRRCSGTSTSCRSCSSGWCPRRALGRLRRRGCRDRVARRFAPAGRRRRGGEDLDGERVAGGGIAGMAGPAVAARAGGEGGEQVDLGEELEEVAAARRARLHEVAARWRGRSRCT